MPLLQVSIRQHNDYTDYTPCQTRPDVGLKAQANLTMKKPWWTLGHEIPNAKSNSVSSKMGGCLFHNWKTTTTTTTNFETPTRFAFLYHHLGSPNQQRLQPTQSSTQRATDDIFQVDRPHGFSTKKNGVDQQLGFCWSYTNKSQNFDKNCVVLQYFPISIKLIGKKTHIYIYIIYYIYFIYYIYYIYIIYMYMYIYICIFQRKKRMLILP